MKTKYNIISSSILTMAMLSPTAQADISVNAAIQSDYVWRGISQNMSDPSIQGGFDYSHGSGVYASIWGASVDFGSVESTELDLVAGWSTELKNGLSLDLGVIEYTYHGGDGADDSNFTEAYLGLGYAGFSAYYYLGDEFSDLLELSYAHDFENGVSMGATYGDYDEYSFYKLGVSTELEGIGLDISYWDTDISLSDVDGDVDAFDLADGRVVFTISKEF